MVRRLSIGEKQPSDLLQSCDQPSYVEKKNHTPNPYVKLVQAQLYWSPGIYFYFSFVGLLRILPLLNSSDFLEYEKIIIDFMYPALQKAGHQSVNQICKILKVIILSMRDSCKTFYYIFCFTTSLSVHGANHRNSKIDFNSFAPDFMKIDTSILEFGHVPCWK